MDNIVVSAPGKVILHGEHSVVYGKAAVAGSLSLRTYLHLSQRDDGMITLNLSNINMKLSWSVEVLKSEIISKKSDLNNPEAATDEEIQTLKALVKENTRHSLAAVSFLYLYFSLNEILSKPLPAVDAHVTSELPIGAGLGSSASYSVCLACSLLHLAGHVTQNSDQSKLSYYELELINKWAFLSEKIFHGSPSGVDNAVATFGGAIKFKKGDIKPMTKMPELKILVVNSRVERSTKELVSDVRLKYNKFRDVFEPIMESLDALVNRICDEYCKLADKESLNESYSVIEELITTNHSLLQTLGVSHPKLDLVCSLARENELPAKLTGAGGGGCAYCLVKPDTSESTIKKLINTFHTEGFECWQTSVGCTGVVIHDKQTERRYLSTINDCLH